MSEKCEDCVISLYVTEDDNLKYGLTYDTENTKYIKFEGILGYKLKFCPECGDKIDWSKID